MNPVALAAGFLHTCALDDNGNTCWGDNVFGQATVPTGLVFETLGAAPVPALSLFGLSLLVAGLLLGAGLGLHNKRRLVVISCVFVGMSSMTTTEADSKIAFTSTRDGNREIYVMDASDGSNLTNLTNHPATDENLGWSPAPAEPVPAISLEGMAALVLLMAG